MKGDLKRKRSAKRHPVDDEAPTALTLLVRIPEMISRPGLWVHRRKAALPGSVRLQIPPVNIRILLSSRSDGLLCSLPRCVPCPSLISIVGQSLGSSRKEQNVGPAVLALFAC